MAAFAGLGTLRHLDLNLVGRIQVFRSDTKARRGDLFDARTQRIADLQRDVGLNRVAQLALQRFTGLCHRDVALRIFATFAGIRFATNAIHRDRKGRVRFGRDRA